MKRLDRFTPHVVLVALLAAGAATATHAQTTAPGPQLDLRYRIEQVQQDGFPQDALASTLRTRLGYRFADTDGWSALVSMQDNRAIGSDRYNSTGNGRTHYPVVADPGDTELDQAYVAYRGWNALDFRLGRQVIKLDNDRFIGNVGFRQLEQTFDALRATWTPTHALRIDYAYLTRVNRVFGAHHPDPLRARQNLDTHLLHTAWMQPAGTLVGYLYLIGNQSVPATSHRDLGVRWVGHAVSGAAWMLDYTLEAARQRAWREGTMDGSRRYLHAELALTVHAWHGKLGHERLGGNGVSALQPPLATLHAFNGWSDRFLVTPVDGLADSYLDLGWKAHRLEIKAIAHRFGATHTSQHYGNELDLSAAFAFDKHLAASLALADYHAERIGVNTRTLWLTLQYSH